jgi:two-component system nitrate/nitrite response regulator NarL
MGCFRAGMRALLRDEPGLTVVAEAGNKSEALEAARSQPDIILLDLDLADNNALEFLPDLMHAAGDAHRPCVTGVPDPELHVRAVCLGAMGVIHKLEAPNADKPQPNRPCCKKLTACLTGGKRHRS